MMDNNSFELEDDDFLDETFWSIPESDLLSYDISSTASEKPLINKALNDFQAPCTSGGIECSSINTVSTESNRKNSVSNTSAKTNEVEFLVTCSPNKFKDADEMTIINSRFVPGFIPKAKKRKVFEDFLSDNNDLQNQSTVSKEASAIIEIKDIINLYFPSEDIVLSSWQKLQSEVSSCPNLLLSTKYYSIQRVLHEASKLKLPKHLVVPVICVQIKKYKAEEPFLVLMDDTGEISGKIFEEVFDLYNDVIREGTALILKKVASICNVLCVKKENLVSIFLEDGSVKHVQGLNFTLDIEEPLKPMNCQCPGTPNEQSVKSPLFSKVCSSTPISSKKVLTTCHKMNEKVGSSSIEKKLTKNSNVKCSNSFFTQEPIGEDKVLNMEANLDVSKDDCNSGNSMLAGSVNQISGETLKPISKKTFKNLTSCSTEVEKQNLASKSLKGKKNYLNYSKSMQKNDNFNNQLFSESTVEEDLFCEDTDDFDEILCNLDDDFLQGM